MIGIMSKEKMNYNYIIESPENGGAFHSLTVQSKEAYDGCRNGGHKDGFGIYSMSFLGDAGGDMMKKEPEYEVLFKRGTPIYKDGGLSEKLKSISGNILISHIRLASSGKGEIDDIHAHPFVDPEFYKIKGIKDTTGWDNSSRPFSSYVLAHNGTIYGMGNSFMTDSEALLLEITSTFKDKIDFDEFKDFLSKFVEKRDFTAINFLLKDPQNDLYALRLAKAKKPGEYPVKQPRLAYYSLYYLKEDHKVIVASEPIDSDRNWKCINNYSLLKIDKNLNVTMAEIP